LKAWRHSRKLEMTRTPTARGEPGVLDDSKA